MVSHLHIAGLEAAQAIQNPDSSVPLINGRALYFRVHFDNNDIHLPTTIRGKALVTLTQTGGHTRTVHIPSLAAATPRHTNGLQSRLEWSGSLNFLFHQSNFDSNGFDINQPADISFELVQIERLQDGEFVSDAIDSLSGTRNKNFKLKIATVMDLRMVGYHVFEDDYIDGYLPAESVVRESRKFIESCFPVSTLNFSTVTVDAPKDFKNGLNFDTLDPDTEEPLDRLYTVLFQHLTAIRTQDLAQHLVSNLTIPEQYVLKTHYVGQLDDPDLFLGGAAMTTAMIPSSDPVAVAEADETGQIQAHELAHLLGRLHPGIPSKNIHGPLLGQKTQHESTEFNKQGFISKEQVDLQKLSLGIDTSESQMQPELLLYNEYYDLMTYLYPQWVSEYTYKKLRKRLLDIQAQGLKSDKNNFYWNVIGEYDLTNMTGVIRYVLPTGHEVFNDLSDKKPSKIQLKILHCKDGSESTLVHVRTKNMISTDTNPNLGVFQETITIKSNKVLKAIPHKIVLMVNQQPLAVKKLHESAELLAKHTSVDAYDDRQTWKLKTSSATPDTNNTNKPLAFRLRYSLDQDAFFFDYDWTPKNKYIEPTLQDLLSFVYENKLAITTTVQFKRNQNLPDSRANHTPVGGEWQTALVSDRGSDTAWISPALTAAIKGTAGDLDRDDPMTMFYTLDEISELDCANANSIGISFRVLMTVAGITVKIFESDSSEIYPPYNKIVLEADGSLGYKKLDYHKPGTADEGTPPQYYQPGLDPDRKDSCN